jgi:hypothetical protein
VPCGHLPVSDALTGLRPSSVLPLTCGRRRSP